MPSHLPFGQSRILQSSGLLVWLLKVALSVWTVAMCSPALGQTATTTALAVSSGGAAVTTVTAGSMITLTASVAAGSTAVKQGQVKLCDGSAPHCSDIHLLGTSQIKSSGQAAFHLRPGTGSYSYRAEFLAAPKSIVPYAGSVSSIVTLTVTGQVATATTILQSGSPGNYTLNASVFGFTRSKSAAAPTGTISFLDTTTSNSTLVTETLASAGDGPFFVNVTNSASGGAANTIVVGDFNGDGNLDLAVGISSLTSTVAILLGDGTGNFTPVTSNPITAAGTPVLAQDFNGDGIPDLLLSSLTTGTLTILLGNGDGTFSFANGSPFPTGYGTSPVVVADFNGDGIPDIAVAGGYYLVVFLGKGDGTFTQVPIGLSLAPADQFGWMNVGDYNGDGIPDLAVLGMTAETISIFTGNGDGTFKTGSSIVVSTSSAGSVLSFTTGDFNGDGKPDLAVPIYGNIGQVAVFLGNGDGTFHAASGSPFVGGQWPSRIAVGDFNGDGIADLFVGAQTNTTDIFIFLGNGDGTFVQAPTGSANLPCCSNTVLGDFNGDGVTDFVSSDFYNSTADVYLTALKQSTSTASGVAVTGRSPQNVIASYSGDSSYSSSKSSSTSLMVQVAAPVITPAAGVIVPGQAITMSTTTAGATIYYRVSGSFNTNIYVPYTGPIPVNSLGSLTVQAYGTELNYGQSATSSATYTVVLPNPTPVLSSVSPAFTTAGGAAFSITINGSGFISGSTGYWGTTALATQYVSATQLTAQVTAAESAAAGIAQITVQTPAPGGGVSNVLQFELDSGGGAPAAFGTATATVTAGETATYAVTLPSGATNVSLRCLNLPSGASCNYTANPSAMTIVTSASTSPGVYQVTAIFTETLPGTATALAFAPFLLLPLAVAGKKRRKQYVWALGLILTILALGISSCGGGGGSVPVTPPTHQATSSGVVALTVH